MELTTAPQQGFSLMGHRKGPNFASITGASPAPFTAAQLRAAPMPAIGDLSAAAKAVEKPKAKKSFKEVMKLASEKAFRGGAAGFAAGVIQVGSFMWMRTAMNYQYANGGTMTQAMSTLYKEGGVARFYKGVSFAIIQNPLSRFGDTAANTGILFALQEFQPTMPVATMTAFASLGGATWRVFLTPVDTFKTTLQVQGNAALELLKQKVAKGGMGVLYNGAAANFAANWVGNYPWFVTFNYLQATVPKYEGMKGVARNAFIGMCASMVSDCISNSLRVIKTIKQTSGDVDKGYINTIKKVIAKDGVKGLFGRGLKTRLITNIAQSMVFSVFWKSIEGKLTAMAVKSDADKAAKAAEDAKSGAKKGGKTGSMTLATLPPLKGGVPPLN